jgi:hypothetical protein
LRDRHAAEQNKHQRAHKKGFPEIERPHKASCFKREDIVSEEQLPK